jgi:4'-phosphopantetheinyl transferase EntD
MIEPWDASTLELTGLFPDTVAVVGVSAPTPLALHPDEERALGDVCEKRRRDFTTGRACAHRALAMLGIHGVPIHRRADRQPVWPPGICGSITHCESCWAAAVARRADVWSLGLDAERRQAINQGVLRRVALDAELDVLVAAPREIPWQVLLFSTKESVFKAWYPIAGTWLGFEDARIAFDFERQAFQASVLAPTPEGVSIPSVLNGRYHLDARFVVTAIVIPPSPPRWPPSAWE